MIVITYLLCAHRTSYIGIYDNEDLLHSIDPSQGISFHDLEKRSTYLLKMDYEVVSESIFHS